MKFHAHQLLLVAGGLLLFIAVIAEHPMFYVPHARTLIFNPESLIAFCRDSAFALIIAYAVSAGIERQARATDNKNAEKKRQQIAQDVFSGVFSKFLPKEYVDCAINAALKSSVIREEMRVTFELYYLTPEQISSFPSGCDGLIQLRSTYHSRIRNVSGSPITHPVRYHHVNRFSLPNTLCGIQSISISKTQLTKSEIESAKLHSAESDSVSYEWPIPLGPGEDVEVCVEGIVIKEVSDNEVWGTVLPTINCEITLSNHVADLTFGFAARSYSKSEKRLNNAKDDLFQWRMLGPMLPNETLIFWWFPSYPHLRPLPSRRIVVGSELSAATPILSNADN
jgi:hypothetical protein